ncbi:quinate pathway repressor protein QutR [Cordyceps javanica]|uniref:Quinate pathway repressor protein QutR n=1 Tax=Cordyceps javanica TaxID=43265 RepID=A0A545V5F6_9HYPO|nr:quinate pathway repressor protein QutR [Cordyceps javanica]TQW08198.1 quinate pathway repressor protein QutR [Cordyceps javanica]
MTMAGVKRPFVSLTENDAVGRSQTSYGVVHYRQKSSAIPPNRSASPDVGPLSKTAPDFHHDATLVLVGVRGSGKSTLAVIASTALNRSVVDLEAAFQRAHKVTTSSYRRLHGTEGCQVRQAEILRSSLTKNPTGRILVCSWMSRHIQALLQEFASTSPVVHVVRDAAAIKAHWKLDDDQKVESLIAVGTIFFRTCTNLEFFNVTEQPPHTVEVLRPDDVFIPSLALKHAEKHFTKFLSLLYPVGTIPFVDSAFPLASIPLEERQFTYAVPLSITHILARKFDIDDAVAGADAVEVTIDIDDTKNWNAANSALAADITRAVGIVRRTTVLPIICHLRVQEAADAATWKDYMGLVAHIFKLAPEMVTVDLRLESDDLRSLLKGRRRSKVIGCREMPAASEMWTGHYWKALYGKAVDVCCDSVRFTRPASSLRDNVEVAQFRTTPATLPGRGIPVAAYNSGSLGRTSACFNSLLTVASAGRMPEELRENVGNSAITPMLATKALFAAFVYEPMKLYVFGANVDYSMSPIMHSSALVGYGIPHEYRPYSASSLSGIQSLIRDPCFGGASIGLPFKVEVITITDYLSRHARAIGAVNTLIPIRHLNDDGSVPTDATFFNNMNRTGEIRAFYGENTDWVGIKACIQSGLSPANAVRSSTCGLVIGAGGMARAAVYAMLQMGVRNIVIYNRTTRNAEKVVAHFHNLFERDTDLLINGTEVRFHILATLDESWPADYRAPTILISCIPTHRIGNEPAPNFTAPGSWLMSPTGGVVFELGYKTLDTPLLQQARAAASRGWVAMDGLDLLPEQGFAQFELFTGRRAPRGLMRRALFQHYKDESGSRVIPGLRRRMQMMAR